MNNPLTSTSTFRANLIIQTYTSWLKSGSKVIDVGCGNGIVSKQLIDHFKLKVTGCDIDDYRQFDDLPFKKIVANKLPFRAQQFDYAIFNDVLHHMPFVTQEQLLLEAHRVAKQILIFEVQPTLRGRVFDYLLNKLHHWDMPIPLTFRSKAHWLALFKKHHLTAVSKTVAPPRLYPFNHIVFRLQ